MLDSWASIEDACRPATLDKDTSAFDLGQAVSGAWNSLEELQLAAAALVRGAAETITWFSDHAAPGLQTCEVHHDGALAAWVGLASAGLSLLQRSDGAGGAFQQLCPVVVRAALVMGAWPCAELDAGLEGEWTPRCCTRPAAVRCVASVLRTDAACSPAEGVLPKETARLSLLRRFVPALCELLHACFTRRGPCADESLSPSLTLLRAVYLVAPGDVLPLAPLLLGRLNAEDLHAPLVELLRRVVSDFEVAALLACGLWEVVPTSSRPAAPAEVDDAPVADWNRSGWTCPSCTLVNGEGEARCSGCGRSARAAAQLAAGSVDRGGILHIAGAAPGAPASETSSSVVTGADAAVFWLVRLLFAIALPNRVNLEGCVPALGSPSSVEFVLSSPGRRVTVCVDAPSEALGVSLPLFQTASASDGCRAVLAALEVVLHLATAAAGSNGGSSSLDPALRVLGSANVVAPVLLALSGRAQTHLDDAVTAACSVPVRHDERAVGEVANRAAELGACLLAFRLLRASQEESRIERALRSLDHVAETLYAGHAGALACALVPLKGGRGTCLDLVLEASVDAAAGKSGLASLRQLGSGLNTVDPGPVDEARRPDSSELALAVLTACAATDSEAEKHQSICVLLQLMFSCASSADAAVAAAGQRHLPTMFGVCLEAATNAVLHDVRSALLSVDGDIDPFGGGARIPVVVSGRAIASLRSRLVALSAAFSSAGGAGSARALSCTLSAHAAVASTALFVTYLYERSLFYPAMRLPAESPPPAAAASMGPLSARHAAQYPFLTCDDIRRLLSGDGCNKVTVASLASVSARLFGLNLTDLHAAGSAFDDPGSSQTGHSLPDTITPPAGSFCSPGVLRAAIEALEQLVSRASEPAREPPPKLELKHRCDACSALPGALFRTLSEVDITRSVLQQLDVSEMQSHAHSAAAQSASGKTGNVASSGSAAPKSRQTATTPLYLASGSSSGPGDYVAVTLPLLPNLAEAALIAVHRPLRSVFSSDDLPSASVVDTAGLMLRHHGWLRVPLAFVGVAVQERVFMIALRGCICGVAAARDAGMRALVDMLGYLARCGELAVKCSAKDASTPLLEAPLDDLRRACRSALASDTQDGGDHSLVRIVPLSVGDGAEWGTEWDSQGPRVLSLDPTLAADPVSGPSRSVIGSSVRLLLAFFALVHRRAVVANKRDVAASALRCLAQVGLLGDMAAAHDSATWPQPAYGLASDVRSSVGTARGDWGGSGPGPADHAGSLFAWSDKRGGAEAAASASASASAPVGTAQPSRSASFRVSQTLHASSRGQLALSILLVVDAWCCAAIQVLPQGSPSKSELLMSACQSWFRNVSSSRGLSPFAMLLALQDELAPRLLPVLLHPRPETLHPAAGAVGSQPAEPLLGAFVRGMLESLVSERDLLQQLAPAGIPAVMSLVPSTKQQCFMFGCYVAKPGGTAPPPLPSNFVDLTSQPSAASTTAPSAGPGSTLKRRRSVVGVSPDASLTGDSPEVPVVAARFQSAGARCAAHYYTMGETALRRQLRGVLEPHLSVIAVWLLMTVGRAATILESLCFFFEQLPEGDPRSALLVDRFQSILQLLAWNLADDVVDSGINRAGLAMRTFANLLAGDARRMELSVTFPLSRMRQAAREISVPLRALIGEPPARGGAAGGWAAPPPSTSSRSAKAGSGGGSKSEPELSVPERIAELADVSYMLIRASVAKAPAGPPLSEAQYSTVRELSSLLFMPLDILLVRYLLMLLASLSSTLSKTSEPVHVKARALVVLQRILVRVGGQDKLDKHVSFMWGAQLRSPQLFSCASAGAVGVCAP